VTNNVQAAIKGLKAPGRAPANGLIVSLVNC
jgi:hypothetical protein